MIVLHEEVNEDQGIREAMLSVRGAPNGSAQIQLMAPLDETSTIAKFLDKRGPGIQQLAYRVSDLDALSERLRAAGRPAGLRRTPARHGELADQLHPPQGRRRRADRAGRAGRRPAPSSLRPLSRRAARCPVASSTACANAAGRRPRCSPMIGRPHHQMCCAGTDFVVTAGAAVGLGRARRRDRADLVFVAVGPGLDPAGRRQRR